MTRRRRIPAVMLAALALTVGLIAGCSSSKSKSTAELPDPTTLLKQSSASTKSLKSVHLDLSVTGKIDKLPVKTLNGDLTTDPKTAAKGDAKITFGGSDVDVKFVVFDADLYAVLTGDTWTDYGPAAEIYDPSQILNPDTGLANVLANFTDAKAEDQETINGQDTIKISGKVPADAVNKLAAQLNATEPLPATVWIQAAEPHQLVQATLDKSKGNSIQMTLSNWNKPVTVDKPAV
nr:MULTISPECIES: LppX_LprAFG lipoprotein [Mycobacterium]